VTTQTVKRVRRGTAERSAGKSTAKKIVRSAYEILLKGGYADFSMRKIAENAGVRLANLQYYFPRMEDLIKALMDLVADIYDDRYREHLAQVEDDPEARFIACLNLNFDDVNNPETRHFFIQFWPFLGVADNYTGKLLVEFYQPQHQQIDNLIKQLQPSLSDEESMRRAEIITAMFEGLLVTTISASKGNKEIEMLRKSILESCLSIARA